MADFCRVFDTAGVPTLRETAMRRLHSGTVPLHDPGYAALAKGGHSLPPLEELQAYFRVAVEAEEIRQAERAARGGEESSR